MPSPNDNIALRNGNDVLFSMRAKDVSTLQDGSLQAIRHLDTPYPVDYGTGGCFQAVASSGVIAAGMGAAAPIFEMRYTGTALVIVRRVVMSMWNQATGFTAGLALFNLNVARSWTVDDSSGNLITPSKLRTSMGAPQAALRVASTGALTASGTRTTDANPIGSIVASISTATQSVFVSRMELLRKTPDQHPVVLVQNEGLVLAGTVPATGTWSFSTEIEWDEVPTTNY